MRMSIPIMGTSSFLGKLGFWCLRQVAFQVQPLSNSSQNFQCWCVKGAVGFLSRLFQVGKSYWNSIRNQSPCLGKNRFHWNPLQVRYSRFRHFSIPAKKGWSSLFQVRKFYWIQKLARLLLGRTGSSRTGCGTTRLPIGRNGLWELIFPGLVVWGFGDQRLHDPQFQNVRGYAYSSNSALPPRALHAIKHATNQVGCFI